MTVAPTPRAEPLPAPPARAELVEEYPHPTGWGKIREMLEWLPSYVRQRATRRRVATPLHLIVAVADHFEPAWDGEEHDGGRVPGREQERRVERWCRLAAQSAAVARDSSGRPLVHTYFCPAEQYEPAVLERIAEFCRRGLGEVEVQLHHGVAAPDTAANARRVLAAFRDELALRHGCLSRWNGEGAPRYGFVHGNWALANGDRHGRWCGVDGEMAVLAETGCYADFTMPAAPSYGQVPKINSLYECGHPLGERIPHRSGRDLARGRAPQKLPLMVQGPLALDFSNGRPPWRPRIENGELTASHPPSAERLALWRDAGITVEGRPDWVFVKLHCHGMDPRDDEMMLGAGWRGFLEMLADEARQRRDTLHFVTAREMTNIALAACDGREGSPSDFRDYRLRLIAGSD